MIIIKTMIMKRIFFIARNNLFIIEAKLWF